MMVIESSVMTFESPGFVGEGEHNFSAKCFASSPQLLIIGTEFLPRAFWLVRWFLHEGGCFGFFFVIF